MQTYGTYKYSLICPLAHPSFNITIGLRTKPVPSFIESHFDMTMNYHYNIIGLYQNTMYIWQAYTCYLVICVSWELVVDIRLREVVLFTESLRTVEVIEDVHNASPVPVICHTTTIVDMTGSVLQNL